MTEADFFTGSKDAGAIYQAVKRTVGGMDGVRIRTSTSQIGFYRKHPFAAVWRPEQYLDGRHPPLVLTVFLHRHAPSDRWKEVVQPSPGRFTHHLELGAPSEVDDDVRRWLREAWQDAA